MTDSLTQLIIAARNGNADAFGQIVRRFQDMAYASAYSYLGDVHLAQDAAQDAFLEAYQKLNGLRQTEAFPGWFRRIVFKNANRQIRNRHTQPVPPEMLSELPSNWPDPLELTEQRNVQMTVQNAIATLPEDQRTVTTLFHIEEYSQKEIAQYLELPISTIKKRLFDARRRLKERMFDMVKEDIQANKPSKDDTFAQKVQFFIAMQRNDLDQIKALLDQNSDLVHVKTEWTVASYHDYWPLHVTPIFWAAATGNKEQVTLFLDHGANINETDKSGKTPLHDTVLKRETEMVDLLLDRGADIDATSNPGYTSLHIAVLNNNTELVQRLIDRGANINAKDTGNRTAADWATLKGWPQMVGLLISHGADKPSSTPETSTPSTTRSRRRKVPTAKNVIGRLIDESGQTIDHKPIGDNTQPLYRTISETQSPILETGIKIIDLLAPLKRGGINGIFTPLSGVGKFLISSQIMASVDILHDGYIIYLGEETEYHTPTGTMIQHREVGVSEPTLREKLVPAFAPRNATAAQKHRLVETGLTLAEDFRQQGNEVLLAVESKIALTEGVLPFLRTNTITTPTAAITTLIEGDHTAGVEPEPLTHLDTVITFNYERAKQALYPAIDPLESYSTLLSLPNDHADLANKTRRLLKRYGGLHYQYEYAGYDSLFCFDDPKAAEICVTRARRMHRYLTQHLPGLEPFTGVLGVHISLEDTLKGCREILEGKHDDLPEEAFLFKGTIEQICEST